MKNYNIQNEDAQNEVNEMAIAYASGVDNNNIFHLINNIREGIKFPKFYAIVKKFPFSMHEWSDYLHISERTMQRYQKENKSFDAIYSEKIMSIAMLYYFGIDVFGNKENFDKWLETKNVALGGILPKELLDNAFGIQLVKDELTRLAYGILA